VTKEREPPLTAPAEDAQPLPERITVIVGAGPDRGKSLTLGPGTHLVGKSSDCAFVLTDPKVSRRHIAVEIGGPDGLVIRDLDSKNGAFVQGARFERVTLGGAGSVTVGDTTLVFSTDSAAAAAAVAAAPARFGGLVGASPKMRELFVLLARLAPSGNTTVLIQGETGVGKDLCARALHEHSPRRAAPFVICDIAGIARSLMESELFGHVRGAFSGAVSDRAGAFETAGDGTIFIDEVGELEPELQPRLLRAIDQRQVKRVGETRYIPVGARVIAATNRDLKKEMADGRFRSDLYHRLAVGHVSIPPLRERLDDLPLLVDKLLEGSGVTTSPSALALLAAYEWPGNVRELRNVLDRARAVLGTSGRVIDPHSLGLGLPAELGGDDTQDFFAARERLLAVWERAFLVQLLDATEGNVSEAARRAGIDRGHLHRLIKKYDIPSRR